MTASPRGVPSSGPARSVYVHSPFCAHRCSYCDFAVSVDRSPPPGPWLDAVSAEWTAVHREGRFAVHERLATLYVGGGTPSLLGPDAMAGLARIVGRERLSDPALEWTVEANPESFTAEVAREWRRAGVNRISLGVQTFHEGALEWMGRLHGPEGARTAVATARSAGLDNLSLDLIFGLPGRLGRSWTDDLDRTLALAPQHVSLYGLTVEAGTPLGRAVAEGREAVAEEPRYQEQYLEAADRLTREGYVHYEVSNFARPGAESRHNRAYWTLVPYLGLGNGAHSYRHPVRRWNVRDWRIYQTRVSGDGLAVAEEETLTPEAHRLERIWLGLRIREGMDLAGLPAETVDLVDDWLGRGLAERHGSTVRLTAEGWLILDRMAVEMDASVARGD